MQDEGTIPVLIAGGGATGMMQALLLAQHGVASIVVEARDVPYETPRAHALNPRTLEICRSLGLDVPRMQREAAPREEAGRVFFACRLLGPVFGSLPYERQDDGARAFTPTPLINLPQTEFEALLLDAVMAEPKIDYRRGWTWKGADEDNSAITSLVAGPTGEAHIRSRYLIGCDGAGSAVRQSRNITMSGEPAVLACLSIVFQADFRTLLADRPGMLFWVTDPTASGTFLGYHMDRLWSFVEMHPPGHIDLSLYSPERCTEIVLNAAGGDIPDMQIIGATPWTMTSQVADQYRSGRVLLAGDSAHRFPPTGGLGLNTGIQDAHNLAWKIAAVERRLADASLLDTYETERRAVALHNAEQSLVNAQRLAALAELRCEPEIWRDPVRFEAWLDEDDRRERIEAAIELQREHFDSFGLQLGFCYPPALADEADVSTYVPQAEPGCRLPHAWLDEANDRSLLDLLSPTRFTLIATNFAADTTVSEEVVLIDLSSLTVPASWRTMAGLGPDEAVLVRPDGHVAWRGPVADWREALRRSLGRDSEAVAAERHHAIAASRNIGSPAG